LLHLLKILLTAVAGLWLGLEATYYAVERGADQGFGTGLIFGAVHAGPWSGWPKTGTREADPYARALFARTSETPLGVTEGLSFIAREDSSGAALTSACDYVVAKAIPAARFWTLSAMGPDGKLFPTTSQRHGFTSSELLRSADGGFEIRVSALARPGNWLEVNESQPFVLMLRLYDTALSANAFAVTASAMPSIVRERCR
jgi:hypothetical protein